MNIVLAFFPIVAAMFYGMAFIFTEKAMQSINVASYIFLVALVELLLALGLMKFKAEPLTWDFMQNKIDFTIVLIAVMSPALGWLFTTYAIKNTSAVYAAMGEISYPIFTVLFAFLFFGVRNFDWTVFLGGVLIMAGSFILVYGQIHTKAG